MRYHLFYLGLIKRTITFFGENNNLMNIWGPGRVEKGIDDAKN